VLYIWEAVERTMVDGGKQSAAVTAMAQ